MKMARDIAMIAVGAGAVLIVQALKEPMKMEMDKMIDCMDRTLEDMM